MTVEATDIRLRLEENEFEAFRFDVNAQVQLTYDLIVRRGPPIDVILFRKEEFASFQRRYRARYLPEVATFHGTNVPNKSVTLPPGTYRLVLNNTDWSRAVPQPGKPYDRIEGECIVDFVFDVNMT